MIFSSCVSRLIDLQSTIKARSKIFSLFLHWEHVYIRAKHVRCWVEELSWISSLFSMFVVNHVKQISTIFAPHSSYSYISLCMWVECEFSMTFFLMFSYTGWWKTQEHEHQQQRQHTELSKRHRQFPQGTFGILFHFMTRL